MIEVLDLETQALNSNPLRILMVAPPVSSFLTIDKGLNLAWFPNIQIENITPTSENHCHSSTRQPCIASITAPGVTQHALHN